METTKKEATPAVWTDVEFLGFSDTFPKDPEEGNMFVDSTLTTAEGEKFIRIFTNGEWSEAISCNF